MESFIIYEPSTATVYVAHFSFHIYFYTIYTKNFSNSHIFIKNNIYTLHIMYIFMNLFYIDIYVYADYVYRIYESFFFQYFVDSQKFF